MALQAASVLYIGCPCSGIVRETLVPAAVEEVSCCLPLGPSRSSPLRDGALAAGCVPQFAVSRRAQRRPHLRLSSTTRSRGLIRRRAGVQMAGAAVADGQPEAGGQEGTHAWGGCCSQH
jgi:hypothetical protein